LGKHRIIGDIDMKRLFLILLAIAVIAPAVAHADYTQELTFEWQYPCSTDCPKDLQFFLYMRGDGEKYDYAKPVTVVDYDPSVGMSGEDEFTVSGPPGAKITKYFVLRAKVGGVESTDSNEANYAFEIPVAAPFSLTIRVKVKAE
jgi:hypothetical protein